jgi:hypothetical protein
MLDVRAIRKQLLFEFVQYVFWRKWLLWKGLGEESVHGCRFNIGKYTPLFDVFQVFGEKIDETVADVPKSLESIQFSPS